MEPRPGQTLRQAIESAIQAPVCAACHSLLEIGFVFEPYDPLGRARATDNGVAIDATSRKFFEFSPLSGALDLGAKASESPAVAKCFARKWLTFALGREPRESEHDRYVDALAVDFSNRDLDIRALIAAVTQTVLFLAP